jgi:phosphoglycolate phosphatase
MPLYDTLLFDLDGTLTDPRPGITRSVQYALAHLGIAAPDLDALTPFIGPPLVESFQRYYALDDASAQRALLWYREYFAATGLYENAVYPGIPELLTALRGRGRRLLVATSKPTIYAERILAHFQLDHHFERIVGSNLDGTRTAKSAVIAYALATLHPQPVATTTVMIGDREHDILGAQLNRLASIAVAYGYGSPAELRAAAPTHHIATVVELAALLLD